MFPAYFLLMQFVDFRRKGDAVQGILAFHKIAYGPHALGLCLFNQRDLVFQFSYRLRQGTLEEGLHRLLER